jgi:microcystin-dependent protein
MGAQFTIPLITVIPGQLIASALWNNEFNNLNTNFIPGGMDSYSDTDAQMQIQTAPFPGSVTSHASNLGGELERIRYQIAAMTGKTYWYQAPDASIAVMQNSILPIGGVIDYPSATPPNANMHLADGTAIDRVLYASLFSLISTTFGIGDGTTTFNLPNYTDKMSIAAGNLYALAATGGSATKNLAHSHTVNSHTHDLANHTHTLGSHTHSTPNHTHRLSDSTTYSMTNPSNNSSSQAIGTRGSGADGEIGNHTPAAGGVFTIQAKSSTTDSGGSGTSGGPTGGSDGPNTNTSGAASPGTDVQGSATQDVLNPYLAMYKMIRIL